LERVFQAHAQKWHLSGSLAGICFLAANCDRRIMASTPEAVANQPRSRKVCRARFGSYQEVRKTAQ
jgi:hypothetical protein